MVCVFAYRSWRGRHVRLAWTRRPLHDNPTHDHSDEPSSHSNLQVTELIYICCIFSSSRIACPLRSSVRYAVHNTSAQPKEVTAALTLAAASRVTQLSHNSML